MTQLHKMNEVSSADQDRGAPDHGGALDVERLAQHLFQKLTTAQSDLLRARAKRDRRAADEQLLCLRATALLLACLPAHPDSVHYRLKIVSSVALREEDGDEASHAWLMVERAVELDQHRQQCPVTAG